MNGVLDGDLRRMRVQLARLRNQLWDASRQMDLVGRVFPKDARVGRARKDVSAALHGAYLTWRILEDAFPSSDLPQEPERLSQAD